MTSLPSSTWRMLSSKQSAEDLPKGLDAGWDFLTGWGQRIRWRTADFIKQAQEVLALDARYAQMAESKLREEALALRDIFRCGRETPAQLVEAVALVREVAARQLGEKHYPCQVAGALVLTRGGITEMATGEGKTLTASIPATLAGWRGRGCHVVTVNDYLARRDAELIGKIYRFCGLSVSAIDQEMKPPERRQAYMADITYCTNKEICADFLRDRLSLGPCRDLSTSLLRKIIHGSGTDRLVMRGLHHAIIDEADSVLIDEAVTPLIISGDAPNSDQVDAFKQAVDLASKLELVRHYQVDLRYNEVQLTDAGVEELETLAEPLGGFWVGGRRREELVTQALTARHCFLLGKQYVVQEGKVVIVDEFTGRLMPDRSWRDGLHQAIEAKESLKVNPPKETFARMSFQRFFRLYSHLSGMTGTGVESTAEFWQIYHRPVVVIPTNKPCIRQQMPDRIFATDKAKWQAVVDQIEEIHKTGRPILVGTRSVRASENLSNLLAQRHLKHAVLNAVRHAEEAQIVAAAGGVGKITVATNMAGRGTDIKLASGVAKLGGLHVLATEKHESGRIDRQLFGRAGRQGDPGSSQVMVSLEDEVLQRYAPGLTRMLHKHYGAGDVELKGPLAHRLFAYVQHRAQAMALSQRKGVLKTDDWLNESLGFAGLD